MVAVISSGPVELQPGDIIEGRYQIIRTIADGGMGTVFLAEHVLIKRRVALKLLHADLASDLAMVRRFMNEASAAGTLGHPHIVESTDMGFTRAGIPFIVFEYLEGCLLTEEIYRLGGLPVRRALQIAIQIASALEAAHCAHIAHLDLKSDNVFLSDRDDALDHVKVLDFGISRFMEADLEITQRGILVGTPEFMAPEQITMPDLVDCRADIHALGVLLYEMLAGHCPYVSDEPRVLLHRIVHEPPPPLVRADRPLPAALERLLFDKLLAKSRDHRIQTMREVRTALDEIAAALRDVPGASVTAFEDIRNAPSDDSHAPERSVTAPPVRAPGRSRAWPAAAAVIAGLAGGGLWLAERQQAAATDGEVHAALETAAGNVATMLAMEARASRDRVDGLASAPTVRVAIETDAATVADMVADGQLFRARPGETIELFQGAGRERRLLLRSPAGASPVLVAGSDGERATSRLVVDGSQLRLIASTPIQTQRGAIGGALAISVPIDLALVRRRLGDGTQAATLVGLAQPLVITTSSDPVGGAALAAPLVIPVAFDREVGLPDLTLVATVAPPAHSAMLRNARRASWGLGAMLLAIYAAGWLAHRRRGDRANACHSYGMDPPVEAG
jgi:eukaryotic-like serine/threonine-protein kinase